MDTQYQTMLPARAHECYHERCESLTDGSEARTACEALSLLVGDLDWRTAVASKFDTSDCGSFVKVWEMYNLDSENVSWEVIMNEFDVPTEYQMLPYAYAMCKTTLELDAWLQGYDVEDGVYDPCAMTAEQVEVDGQNRLWAAHNCDSWDLTLSLFFEGTTYSNASEMAISSDAEF